MNNNEFPPVIPEEYWKESHFSIAKYYGRIRINRAVYMIVDKHGRDIFELSDIAVKEGKQMAIEPGEPCDLCRVDWIPSYKALGRDKIIELIKEGKTLNEVKEYIKQHKK